MLIYSGKKRFQFLILALLCVSIIFVINTNVGGKISGKLSLGQSVGYSAGHSFFDRGEYSKAIDIYLKAIKSQPNYHRMSWLAYTYALNNDFVNAEYWGRKSAELYPNHHYPPYYLGLIYMTERKDIEAEEAFKRALKINPIHYDSHFNYGLLLLKGGRIDESEKEFSAVDGKGQHGKAAKYLLRNITKWKKEPPWLLNFCITRYFFDSNQISAGLDHFDKSFKHFKENTKYIEYSVSMFSNTLRKRYFTISKQHKKDVLDRLALCVELFSQIKSEDKELNKRKTFYYVNLYVEFLIQLDRARIYADKYYDLFEDKEDPDFKVQHEFVEGTLFMAQQIELGRDGSSEDKSIVLKGSYNTMLLQQSWLISKFHGVFREDWEKTGQYLLKGQSGMIDEISIKLLIDGSEHKVYFDVTEIFGSLSGNKQFSDKTRDLAEAVKQAGKQILEEDFAAVINILENKMPVDLSQGDGSRDFAGLYALGCNNLGIAYMHLGDLDKAIAALEKGKEALTHWSASYYLLGQAYCQQGVYQKSEQNFRKAFELDPDTAIERDYYLYMIASLRLNRLEQSELLFTAAQDRFPDSFSQKVFAEIKQEYFHINGTPVKADSIMQEAFKDPRSDNHNEK